MKSKLAFALTAILGFSIATFALAQESMNSETMDAMPMVNDSDETMTNSDMNMMDNNDTPEEAVPEENTGDAPLKY